jgi:prophage regulatory protein
MPVTEQTAPAPIKHSTKKTTTPNQDRLPRFIRLPEVKARVGLSRSTIYNRISEGTFPAPIRLGEKSVAWVESTIDGWIQEKIAGSVRAAA